MAKNPMGPSSPQDDVLFPSQPEHVTPTYRCDYCGKDTIHRNGHLHCRNEAKAFMNEKIDSLKNEEEEE